MSRVPELNAAQHAAVTAGNGPLLIVAGPGTGKTKTLTARIAHLIESGLAAPDAILALTFTKKAAQEMQARVVDSLNALSISGEPTIATFHGLAQQLLGGGHEFISESERLLVVRSLPKPNVFKTLPPRELGLIISRAKNKASLPLEKAQHVKRLVKAYDLALAERRQIDFDDLLVRTKQLLESDAAARQTVQQKYQHILVDEFQDTNRLQYELLHLLRGTDNLFVIGDPNQSIYAFRGSDGTIFEQFQADFPQHTQVVLTDNYRSAPELVKLSNAVQASAPLVAQAAAGGQARAVEVLNEYSEAHWVLHEIQQAIGGGDFLRAVSDDRREQHRTLRDFAVLYRSRSAAAALQKLFAESGLPYQVVGDGSPYEQPEVQALLAVLNAIAAGQEPQLEGFTASQRQAVLDLAQQGDSQLPSALAERIITILGLEPSDDLSQTVGTLVRFRTVPAAMAYFARLAEQAFYDPQADAITLLTIHAAKGLEFPHVFLIAAEEGILPSARGDLAEERRLFYVAVTRAKERLDILHARWRSGQAQTPSRFITDIPPHILPRLVDPELELQARRLAKRAAKRSQQSLF